jgi:hypothetical protein
MRLSKGPVFLSGFLATSITIAAGFLTGRETVILAALDAMVWIVGLGLGANVGAAVQRSALYKPELDTTKREGQ